MSLLIPLLLTITFTGCAQGQRTALATNKGNNARNHVLEPKTMDFVTFVSRNKVFMDKTSLIHTIMVESKSHSVILLIFPPKWGKTLNLKMLLSFLEIPVDKYGHRIPFNQTQAHDLFVHGKIVENDKIIVNLAKPLMITGHMEFLHDYHGKYPVIYIDFSYMSSKNYEEFVFGVKKLVGRIFRRFSYLVDEATMPKSLNRSEVTLYNNIMMGTEYTESSMVGSFVLLSKFLHSYFNEQVIILIDDYDTPLNVTLCHDNYEDREKTLKLYQTLLRTTLKDNPYLEKSVIVGNLKLHQLNFPSDFYFVNEYTTLHYQFVDYFGFNQLEIDALLDYHAIQANERTDIEQWYNGYRLGASSSIRIYNPRCVMIYINRRTIGGYWARDRGVNFILRKALNIFFFENAISILLSDSVYFIDLLGFGYGLKEFQRMANNVEDQHIATNIALDYLLSLGYLTVNGTFTGEACLSKTPVQVPNREVYLALVDKVIPHFTSKLKIPRSVDYQQHFETIANLLKVCISRQNSTCDRLKSALEQFLLELPKFHPHKPGIPSKGDVLHPDDVVIRSLFNFLFVYTDVFSFLGFNELMLEHKNQGVGIILKFNNVLTEEELQQAQNYYRTCFQKLKRITKMKTIEIYVMMDKQVQIRNQVF